MLGEVHSEVTRDTKLYLDLPLLLGCSLQKPTMDDVNVKIFG